VVRFSRKSATSGGGNNFYEFPDNQLTKFRVFIGG